MQQFSVEDAVRIKKSGDECIIARMLEPTYTFLEMCVVRFPNGQETVVCLEELEAK